MSSVKEQIRKEIERLEGENNCGTSDFIEAKRIAYKQVKKALDSLPDEQSLEGLDEEIQRYFDGWGEIGDGDNIVTKNSDYIGLKDLSKIARHFAEWGAEHLRDATKMIPEEELDKKLAEYFRESSEDFQTRAKDLLFNYECEGEDTKLLLEKAMHFVEDVQDFFHHIAIV